MKSNNNKKLVKLDDRVKQGERDLENSDKIKESFFTLIFFQSAEP